MPSLRTDIREWLARHRPRGVEVDRHWLSAAAQRLNVRLILTLGMVALVGLSVSGIAISQILPGYFAEQTRESIATAAETTSSLLEGRLQARAEEDPQGILDPAVREGIIRAVARDAARFFNATVTILGSRGQPLASAEPPNPEGLEERGLRRETDPDLEGYHRQTVDLGGAFQATYQTLVTEPYSARVETLARIREALIGTGLLALAVSFFTGVVAARTVTRPISRLGEVASRIARGQLDERVPRFDVLEVDELGRQFNVMADRLAGTLRMLEADRDRLREFVADVSHELRTPIAALRMYNELLREGSVDEETRNEFLQRSNEQIRRLEWLSTNLLDLSRIDAGIFPLDMRVGDVRDPIQAVVQALSEVAMNRAIALESAAPAHPVELRFDRERMVQLLTNLVGNALKFTPRGGSVSVRLLETDDDVTIEVRDSGAGIPAEELPRIFERFYRGTNTGDARATGSGLGLAIVRSIVEMHGGEIDVASVVGRGTVFRISLPRRDAVAPAVVADATARDGDRTGDPATSAKVNETLRSDHSAPTARP